MLRLIYQDDSLLIDMMENIDPNDDGMGLYNTEEVGRVFATLLYRVMGPRPISVIAEMLTVMESDFGEIDSGATRDAYKKLIGAAYEYLAAWREHDEDLDKRLRDAKPPAPSHGGAGGESERR